MNQPKEIPVLTKAQVARFWSKVKIGGRDECWLWQGSFFRRGYGQYSIAGLRNLKAHRVSFSLNNKDLVDGKLVCHRCDNPPCCNPAHLFLGTNQGNSSDMTQKSRQAKWEKNGRAKLTKEQAEKIKKLRGEGWTYKELMKEFHVSSGTIWWIIKNKHWV